MGVLILPYLIVCSSAPVRDLCFWHASGLQAVGAKGAECHGGCAVKASYSPPVDRHFAGAMLWGLGD